MPGAKQPNLLRTTRPTGRPQVRKILGPSPQSDFSIEVGDAVTYAMTESPTVKTTIIITAGPSQPSRGLVNEHAPLAKAILGLCTGEIADFILPGQPARSVRIFRIRRDSVSHTPSSI